MMIYFSQIRQYWQALGRASKLAERAVRHTQYIQKQPLEQSPVHDLVARLQVSPKQMGFCDRIRFYLVSGILILSLSLTMIPGSANAQAALRPNVADINPTYGISGPSVRIDLWGDALLRKNVDVTCQKLLSTPATSFTYFIQRCRQLCPYVGNPTKCLTPDKLFVGRDSSWAHLQLKKCSPNPATVCDLTDPPILQAGPNPETDTLYSFPCELQIGEGVIYWGLLAEPMTCKVVLPSGVEIRADLTPANQRTITGAQFGSVARDTKSKKFVDVKQLGKPTLIYPFNTDGLINIDVLLGVVLIQSPTAEPIEVSAGNRFIYDGSSKPRVEPIDVEQILAESETVQIFLDTSTWSREGATLIADVREQLGLPPGDDASGEETNQTKLPRISDNNDTVMF